MLNKIYNHIKNSVNSPSFFWRNRLFVERQEQAHRILSQLGLTFRNSKWSTYALLNINPRFRADLLSIVKYIFTFLFSLLLAVCFWDSSLLTSTWSSITTAIFTAWDATTAWAISVTSFLFGLVYKYTRSFVVTFFEKTFQVDISTPTSATTTKSTTDTSTTDTSTTDSDLLAESSTTESSTTESSTTSSLTTESSTTSSLTIAARLPVRAIPNSGEPKVTNSYLSKNDQKLVLFRWLTQDVSSLGRTHITKNLFNGLVDQKSWDRNYLFFPKLYQLVHIMQIAELTTAHQSLRSSVARLSTSANRWDSNSLDTLLNNSDVGTKYNALLTDFEVASSGWLKFPKESRTTSLKLLEKNLSWNLSAIGGSNYANRSLALTVDGNHFLGTQVSRKMKYLATEIPELNQLNTIVENQLSIIKQQRWLYKYSNLHRESLKGSHKVTQAKRLISSGFYDSSLTSQNLWASSFFKHERASNYDTLIKTALKENYGGNLVPVHNGNALRNLTTSFTNQRALTNLSSLESSYFWSLKRFYLFNTSPANTPFTKRTLALNPQASQDVANFNYTNNQAELKATTDLILKNYSLVNKGLVISPSRKMSSPQDFNGLDALAGLNLELSDLDFLSGDNLSLMLSLYTPITSANGKARYFSVLQYDNSDFTDFEFKDLDVNATYPHSRTHSRIFQSDVKMLTDLIKLLSVFK